MGGYLELGNRCGRSCFYIHVRCDLKEEEKVDADGWIVRVT